MRYVQQPAVHLNDCLFMADSGTPCTSNAVLHVICAQATIESILLEQYPAYLSSTTRCQVNSQLGIAHST